MQDLRLIPVAPDRERFASTVVNTGTGRARPRVRTRQDDGVELVDLVRGDARWHQALPVLQELRPHLTAELLDRVLVEG